MSEERDEEDLSTQESSMAGGKKVASGTKEPFQELKAFIHVESWPAVAVNELMEGLNSVPENLETSVTDHLVSMFNEYIDGTYPASVKSKGEVMQCLKKDWFAKEALGLVKSFQEERAAMIDFKPLIAVEELADDMQNEARSLLHKLKPCHLLQLEQAAKSAWNLEFKSYEKDSAWLVSDAKRCASLEKAFLHKRYYALMKDIVSGDKFNFEPLVHPRELADLAAQERAFALMSQVKEEQLPEIHLKRDKAWADQLHIVQCLSAEEKSDAEKAFNHHVYWDIVASIVESENSSWPEHATRQGGPCTSDVSEMNEHSWVGKPDIASSITSAKRTYSSVESSTLPQRRKRMTMDSSATSCTVMDVVTIHTKANNNQLCTVEAGVMHVADDLRTVSRKNVKTGTAEPTTVGALQLADSGGVIACTFWGSLADTHWRDLGNKFDESIEQGKVSFYRITHLSVSEHKTPAVTPLRKLNSTEQTTVEFMGMKSNTVHPQDSMFLKDFTSLKKQAPHVCCLQGTVAEPWSRRQAANGMDMCAFHLVSRDGIAVSCVAFGTNAALPFLEPNVQVAIFGAQALDDRQNPNSGKGALWLYDDAFVMKTGEVDRPPRIVRVQTMQ